MSNKPKTKIAAGSTIDPAILIRAACFEETVFRVRKGPNYKKTGEKAPSAPPLFTCVGMDVFRTPKKVDHIVRFIDLPTIPAEQNFVANGVPPLFVVNTQLPDYDPPNPLWGQTQTDGPGWCVAVYLMIKPETQAALQNLSQASPAVRLLKNFIEKEEFQDRFKGMANLLNPAECSLGFTLKKLLVEYNMKPVLTRPQHRFYTNNATYFEIDVDVHIFGYVARKGLSSLKTVVSQMIWDVGVTLEGQEDDELPETILAVVHWRKLDLEKDGLKIDFGDEATSNPHLPSNLPSSPLASFSTTPSPASARAIQKAMGSLMVGDTKQSPSKLGTSPARSTGAASPARSTDSPAIRSVVKAAGADDDDEFLDADEEFYDADP